MMDGVIVDSERGELYMMTPEGTVEAIALNNGKVRWSSDAGAKPLMKHGDLLFVQIDGKSGGKRQLDLVALDVSKKGRKAIACDSIELPKWAPDTVDQPLGGSLAVDARWAPDVVYIVWNASMQWVGRGAPPPDVAANGGQRQASGIVRCDLMTGNLLGGGSEVPAPIKIPRAPDADTEVEFTRMASNGKHYIHGKRVEGSEIEYSWSVFAHGTDQLVHEVPKAAATGPFLLWGDAIIYNSVEPDYGVRALHPATGTVLWEHELRATWYTGQMPQQQ